MISRRELMAVALTLILIAACVAYVDRPVAEFAAARLPESALFPLAIAILRPLDLVLGMMVLWLAGWLCCLVSARWPSRSVGWSLGASQRCRCHCGGRGRAAEIRHRQPHACLPRACAPSAPSCSPGSYYC